MIYEGTFTVAESVTSSSVKELAILNTGLHIEEITELYVVIACTNDTEADMSFNHFKFRTQSPRVTEGYYVSYNTESGIIYSSNNVTIGNNQGVCVDGVGKYVATLTIRTRGSDTYGYAASGDYSVKLYKPKYDYFGLNGI